MSPRTKQMIREAIFYALACWLGVWVYGMLPNERPATLFGLVVAVLYLSWTLAGIYTRVIHGFGGAS